VPCSTFREVFATLQNDKTLLGIVAIENTIAGSLLQNHDLLKNSGCQIIGEQKLRIEHNLAALPGQRLADIAEVRSHPIALMQCVDFLEKNPQLLAVEKNDTASAAREIAEQKTTRTAAICSALAAEMYGLEILVEGIETNKRNFTRFLVIAQPEVAAQMLSPRTANKASLVFTLAHEEGSLSKILTILSFYHNNLSKIQSLPIIGKEWEYRFYVNLTFANYDLYRQSLEAIKPLAGEFQILGEYCEAKQ
jgi:prephenate dehydratase